MRFLGFPDLGAKGKPGSKVTVWRQEREGRFPKRRRFGPQRYGWPEPLIDRYLEAIAGGHSEPEATIIAEQYLAALLARSDEQAA